MDDDELRRSAALEDRHWWYSGRRALVRRLVRGVPAGRAVDVGPGPGGNSAVLRVLGWEVTGVELTETGAQLCASRDVPVVRGDATRLPIRDQSIDLVMSTDVWEHVEDHEQVARESFRVLRPGGRLLVAVPAGMSLWSGHDVALGHVRRYERSDLVDLVRRHGFVVDDVRRGTCCCVRSPGCAGPATRARARWSAFATVLNAALRATIGAERVLPVGRLPGLSLVVRAHRP